jgi:hypothetical protein
MGRPQALLEGRRSVAQGRSKIVERSISTFNLTMACDETTKVQPTHEVTSLLTAEAGARAVPKRARAKAKVTFILFQTVLIVKRKYTLRGTKLQGTQKNIKNSSQL